MSKRHDALRVNILGAVHGTCAFAPGMIASGRRAAIVNVASLGGLASLPLAVPYIASKHALIALSECLYFEMEALQLPIDVSVVVRGSAARHRRTQKGALGLGWRPLKSSAAAAPPYRRTQ